MAEEWPTFREGACDVLRRIRVAWHTKRVALILSWLDKLFGASDAWASTRAEKNSLDATPIVLADYPEPTEQKTEQYRVSVVAETTPINNVCGAWVLTRTLANASGTVSYVGTTDVVGGDNGSGIDADLTYNATTKRLEVVVTGAAATVIKWRCARLESA